MLTESTEKALARFLAVGAFAVTVFIWTGTGTDPVNVTKLWLSGGVSIGATAIAIRFAAKQFWVRSKWVLFLCALFILAMLNSVVQSPAPLSQTFYGTYGRNTGMLTYILLVGILISSTAISREKNFSKVLDALFAAGVVNVAYCAWVLAFGDFIPWNNQYKKILGTLGNPDFISAFLGLFIVLNFSRVFSSAYSKRIKTVGLLLSVIALVEIVKSHAIQGLVVTAGGIIVVGFFVVRDRFSKSVVQIMYLSSAFILGFLAVMGTLQKGPLKFVYKKSVSLRGSYWHAGLEMGNSHPLTGIGMDSYGDWYRATRPAVALVDTPPVSVVSNVSHNVVIDFFAFGGYPLLLSYLGILSIGVYSILKTLRKTKKYDPVFSGLCALWLCYEVQSFISINQIGLAIWGWIVTGLLYAYTKLKDESNVEASRSGKKVRSVTGSVVSANLVGGIGLAVGLLIAFPPMSADTKWRNALDSRNLQTLEQSLQPSFFNPSDANKYGQAIVTLRNSNLNDLALKYTLKAIEFNPNNSDFWKLLFTNPSATDAQKNLATENAKRLDPKNADPFGLHA